MLYYCNVNFSFFFHSKSIYTINMKIMYCIHVYALYKLHMSKYESTIYISMYIHSITYCVYIQDQYKLCHEILQAYLDSFDTYANFKAV